MGKEAKGWEKVYKKKEFANLQRKPATEMAELIPLFKEEGVQKILDLGCGRGRHAKLLAENGFQVTGSDISRTALEEAAGITEGLDASFVECDMQETPFPNESFDAIICYHVFQHGKMEDIRNTAGEMKRLLKKNGLLSIITISSEQPRMGGREIELGTFIGLEKPDGDVPHHFFTEEELRSLFSDLKLIRLEKRTGESELTPGSKKEEWILLARKT